MAKREFAKLMLLTDYRKHDEAFQQMVVTSVGTDGWTLACDRWGHEVVEKFFAKDLTFLEEGAVKFYDVIDGRMPADPKRLRFRDMSATLVFRDKWRKDLWIMWHDEVDVPH